MSKDLGGPQVHYLPTFLDDQISSRIFRVQKFNQMTLEEAIPDIEN